MYNTNYNKDILDFKSFSADRDEQTNDTEFNSFFKSFKADLKAEIKAEIKAELKDELKAEAKEAVEHAIASGIIENAVSNVIANCVKDTIVDTVIHSPKLKVEVIDIVASEDAGNLLQRTKALEYKTGIKETDEEDHPEPNLSQRIASIESCIKSSSYMIPTDEPMDQSIIDSKTAYRATLLVNHAKAQKPLPNGERVLDCGKCYEFLKCELPDEIKAVTSNLQQLKKEVLNKVEQLYPYAKLVKSKYGRHGVGLVLKENDSNGLCHKKSMSSSSQYHKRISG
jgi:ubiquitin